MPVIKVSFSHPTWPIARQTPGGLARWDDTVFLINVNVEECDGWVVLNDLRFDHERTICPPERTLLINTEPPTQGTYPRRFVSQFNTVATSGGSSFQHPNIHETFPPVPWYLGINLKRHHVPTNKESFTLDYDILKRLNPPKKTKLLSVICTNKVFTDGHRRRIEFVRRLMAYFGSEIDVFGEGFRFIHDKCEGTADYEYHIVIENSRFPHYWTEKLSDAFLAWTYPIYYGCPNISQYFDPESMSIFDINSPDQSIKMIEDILERRPWREHLSKIAEAREKVLDQYNLFPVMIRLLELWKKPAEKRLVQMESVSKIIGRGRSTLRQVRRRLQFGLGITKIFPSLRRI